MFDVFILFLSVRVRLRLWATSVKLEFLASDIITELSEVSNWAEESIALLLNLILVYISLKKIDTQADSNVITGKTRSHNNASLA